MTGRLAAMLNALRDNGVRVTVPRRAIIESLDTLGPHVTAEELAAHVQARHPEVHESTVYRTLDRLTGLGVVEHVHLGHGRAVYHLPDAGHQHLHCDGCGAVVEAPNEVFAELMAAVDERFGFELDLDHFALGGRCAECRRLGRTRRSRGRLTAAAGAGDYQPSVPGPPLKGPTTFDVIQPP